MAESRADAVVETHEFDDDERLTPRWLPAVTLLLSLIGLGVSIYLTYEHYTGNKNLICSATSTINCLKVTTSPQSVVLGIPVAVFGLAFFVAMVGLNSPWAWRPQLRLVQLARFAGVILGMAAVLYLVFVELFQVHAICLWCTAVHGLTFVLFVLVFLFGPTLAEMLARD